MKDLKQIAEENHTIVVQGRYTAPSQKTIPLTKPESIGFFPQAFDAGLPTIQALLQVLPKKETPCIYTFSNLDSYTAAKEFDHPLVMNFANACHPGGGYISGALAQEESLCRMSNLYPALTDPETQPIYEYNKYLIRSCGQIIGTDSMLLHKNVMVFRDIHLNFLEEPYVVSVGTIAAPDFRKGIRRDGVYRTAIRNRIRKYLTMAAAYGYDQLVLGAWGCGAFKNQPEDIAHAFYDILQKEGYGQYFTHIVFAVLESYPAKSHNGKVFKALTEELNQKDRKKTDVYSGSMG